MHSAQTNSSEGNLVEPEKLKNHVEFPRLTEGSGPIPIDRWSGRDVSKLEQEKSR